MTQLKEYPKRVIRGDIYYVIREEKGIQIAVKDNDIIVKGKAQLYQIQKDQVKLVPESKDGSDKFKFYAAKEKTGKTHTQQPPQLKADIDRKIEEITDKLTKGDIPKLEAYWHNDTDEPINELKLAENKMYSGWKL